MKALPHFAEVVEFACGIADHLKGEVVENVSAGIDTYSIRQPLGVSPYVVGDPPPPPGPLTVTAIRVSHKVLERDRQPAFEIFLLCNSEDRESSEGSGRRQTLVSLYCCEGRGRHLPLQFPSYGAPLDVPHCHCSRQHFCAEAL